MWLQSISITQVRNLNNLALTFAPGINFINGPNGSGKTSILEAIYILGTGQSFKTKFISEIIQYQHPNLLIFGQAQSFANSQTIRLGVEKSLTQDVKLRINNQDCKSNSELAQYLPMQIVNSFSFSLIDGGPKIRRQYIDWAMFHVEHSFWNHLTKMKSIIKQRNAAIKANKAKFQPIKAWDEALILQASNVDFQRVTGIQKLKPILNHLLANLFPSYQFNIEYERGWPLGRSLEEAIEQSYQHDLFMGFTTKGPQRANIKFTLEGRPISQCLSRGQQKIFLFALYLARAELIKQETGKRPMILIDDMFSELDPEAATKILNLIIQFKSQIIIANVSSEPLKQLISDKKVLCHIIQAGKLI